MKRVRLLLLLIPAVLLLIFGKIWAESRSFTLQKAESVKLDTKKWSLLVARAANEGRITVESSGRAVSRVTGAFVTEGLDIMVPVEYANDVFDCAAFMMKPVAAEGSAMNVIHLERGEHIAEFSSMDDDRALLENDEGIFVSVASACSALNLEYEFDIEKNKLVVSPKDPGETVIPARYDLRDYDRAPDVKNQGSLGTCWAFAAMSGIESVLRPKEQTHFSVDHLTSNNSFHFALERGGADVMGMAYLLGWQGPVYEDDDPYNDGITDNTLKPVKHVQEIRFIGEKDYDELKRSVYKYGAVETSIKNTMPNTNTPSENYNMSESAYYYSGDAIPDHEIIIVGWDDDFPKENFNETPPGNGAFICQNSWGKIFGDEGYFYVSYYDTNIGKNNLVYTSVENTDNFDNIYQSDLCGWVSKIGYNSERACAMNVFTARDNEELQAIGFYATGKNAKYKLYVINDFTDADSVDLTKLEPVGSGDLDMMGYYTIPIDSVYISKGERFAVALDITVPDAVYPIAVENNGSEITSSVDISDGEGYVGDGRSAWVSTEGAHNCNVCLKAYSKGK